MCEALFPNVYTDRMAFFFICINITSKFNPFAACKNILTYKQNIDILSLFMLFHSKYTL